jgi:dipeptidyl aminopeptidase/acylaminoacyl peptidase
MPSNIFHATRPVYHRLLSTMLSCIICAVASAQARPFTYQEMLLLDRISGLSVDATGHYALFNVRATDMEKNKGVSALWLKDLSEPTTPERKLGVSEGGARDAQWSPDGQTIYFLSSRGEGGTAQVWKTDVSGAKAEQVTRLPLDVGAYRIAPDTAKASSWRWRYSRNAPGTRSPAR